MQGVIKGVKYCQFERAAEINDGIYDRNKPSAPLTMYYNPRSTQTRYVGMTFVNCEPPATTPCKKGVVYNPYTTFNPGVPAPFSGYTRNVDQESRLQNRFFPLQKSAQAQFIPSSNSDLYKVNVPAQAPQKIAGDRRQRKQDHSLLFKKERFYKNDVNKCKLGEKLFNNYTRWQVRNLSLRSFR